MSSNTGQKLKLDIEALHQAKTNGEKFHIINKISQKTINNEYPAIEIESFLKTIQNSFGDKFNKILYTNLVRDSKNTEYVVKLLKSEDNDLVIRTINKCHFFWTSECQKQKPYNVEFYVKEIFPVISYSNRMKILQKLSENVQDERQAEEYFNKFQEEFSRSAARPFLKYCSSDFILDRMKRGITLNNRELFALLPKRSEFVLKYLQKLYEAIDSKAKYLCLSNVENFQKILKYFLLNYTQKIIQLLDDHKESVMDFPKAKDKLTKRILGINECKKLILKNPKFYSQYLEKNAIFKRLTEDEFKIFYKAFFPKDKENFDYDLREEISDYLNYYKKSELKLNLLLETYHNLYNENLLDKISNITGPIMKLLDTESRVKYAQQLIEIYTKDITTRKNKNFNDIHEVMTYLTFDLAFPKFKESIYISSDLTQRSKFLEHMIKCCCINNDMNALLDVLTYFNQRHRNELTEIRTKFVRAFVDNVNFNKLNSEHWKQIHEFLNIILTYQEASQFWFIDQLLVSYIEYELKNNLPIENSIRIYMIFSKEIYGYGWSVFDKKPQYQKLCLVKIGTLIPEIYKPDQISNQCAIYLEELDKYNQKYPKNQINIFDFNWICDEIDKSIKENNNLDRIFSTLVHYKENTTAKAYLKKIEPLLKVHRFDVKLYLEECPSVALRDWKEFINAILSSFWLKDTIQLIKTGKLENVPDLQSKIKTECLKIVKSTDKDDVELKSSAIRLLTIWLDADDFYELIKDYYPTDTRLTTGTEKANVLYEIQIAIAHSLAKYNNHSKTFEALRKFCVGDYLKLTVGSLNSVCIKSQFHKVKEFLDSCLDTPVSFKKHVIRLQLQICNRQFSEEFLRKLLLQEKNPSIREIIITKVMDNFVAEPSQETWNLLKTIIDSLSYKDQNSLKSIMKFTTIPNEFVSQYFEFIWNALLKLECKENLNVHEYQVNLLSAIKDSLDCIPESIIWKILEEHMYVGEIIDSIHNNFNELAAIFVMLQPSNDKRIELIAQKMKYLFTQYWTPKTSTDEDIEKSLTAKDLLNHLIKTFYQTAIQKNFKSQNSDIVLQKLKEKLFEIFNDPSVYIYIKYMKLRLSIIYIQNRDNSLKQFGKSIREIVENEFIVYDSYIACYLAAILVAFVSEDLPPKSEILDIIEGLLEDQQSIQCILVVINLINTKDIYKEKYNNILKVLQSVEDKRVQMYLNSC